MRILLSTIGSRGDVQPLLALALALRDLGQDTHLCVPPDFRAWIEGFGFAVTTIGPELRPTGKTSAPVIPSSPEQMRRMMADTVATQFATLTEAARDCQLLVGATALQVAAPSVAESLGIPYVFAAFSPNVLPSPIHAPPLLPSLGPVPAEADYATLWEQDALRWNAMWREAINSGRSKLGLAPVTEVRDYILTDRPWLAADPVLAPWPDAAALAVNQTGAWLLEDDRPLSADLEAFLAAGEPPVYFGFGSIRATPNLSEVMIGSARALGRRAILSAGWAELALVDEQRDCFVVDEVNQQALFPRVAAVVHHGGAGTTTAAARAGAPQVIIPQLYDQPYWAQRVQQLGIGIAPARGAPDSDSLTAALGACLASDVAERADAMAGRILADGADIAARQLLEL
jgi:vancomycin aglycone glucosyltransferase